MILPVDEKTAHLAMAKLQADPNLFSPQILAKFEKTQGTANILQKGDEFLIRITGPWNGPVRVEDVSHSSFKFVTLGGHLEAGEIRFKVSKVNESESLFEIESLARSKDALVDFIYDKVPISKFCQTEMWTSFCKSFAEYATELGEKRKDEIREVSVVTYRQNEETGEWEKV